MELTRDELKRYQGKFFQWHGDGFVQLGGLLVNRCWNPVAFLAMERDDTLRSRLERLAAESPLDGLALSDVESILTLQQRNVIASALYDWTAWTMRHGLGPGIMTALRNGQRDEILAAIDKDLAEGL